MTNTCSHFCFVFLAISIRCSNEAKPFHHIPRNKILQNTWSISGALSSSLSTRHFESAEGLGGVGAPIHVLTLSLVQCFHHVSRIACLLSNLGGAVVTIINSITFFLLTPKSSKAIIGIRFMLALLSAF